MGFRLTNHFGRKHGPTMKLEESSPDPASYSKMIEGFVIDGHLTMLQIPARVPGTANIILRAHRRSSRREAPLVILLRRLNCRTSGLQGSVTALVLEFLSLAQVLK